MKALIAGVVLRSWHAASRRAVAGREDVVSFHTGVSVRADERDEVTHLLR